MPSEALKQLLRVAEAMPEDLLDMSAFSSERDCGTAHCLGGWAAVDPWMLENTGIGSVFSYSGDFVVLNVSEPAVHLAHLFGIGLADAENLFALRIYLKGDIWDRIRKRHVVANIRRLLAGEPALPYSVLLGDEGRSSLAGR